MPPWPHILVAMAVLPSIARLGEVFLAQFNQPLYDRFFAGWVRISDFDALGWILRPWRATETLLCRVASWKILAERKQWVVRLGLYISSILACVVGALTVGLWEVGWICFIPIIAIPVAALLAGSLRLSRTMISSVANLSQWRRAVFRFGGLLFMILAYSALFLWLFSQMFVVAHMELGELGVVLVVAMLIAYFAMLYGWVVLLPAAFLILFSLASFLLFIFLFTSRWFLERVLHYIVQDPTKMVFTSMASVASSVVGLSKALTAVAEQFWNA